MEKPVCRLCGSAHWSGESHKFASSVAAEGPARSGGKKLSAERVLESGGKKKSENPDAVRSRRWREGNREKYNARQRELMRRRRGEQDG